MNKLDKVIEEARAHFWQTIAEAYPEVTSRDNLHADIQTLEGHMTLAVEAWLEINCPYQALIEKLPHTFQAAGRCWFKFIEYSGTIYWANNQDDLAFYATPGWDAQRAVAFEISEWECETADSFELEEVTVSCYLAAVAKRLAEAIWGEL